MDSHIPPPTHAALPLCGLTFSVKDNIEVAGLPWTAGHPLFSRRVGREDAVVVRRLKLLGAMVVGVSPTDAGGFGVTSPGLRNPLDGARIAGGSSGGAAVAVATGLADFGLGTDTAGSIRIPAACCGLYGFKPSFGALPLGGVWPLAPRFDHLGFLARDMSTLNRVVAAVLPARDQDHEPRQPRIAFDPARLERCDRTVAEPFRLFVEHLGEAGLAVSTATLPDRNQTVEAHGILTLEQAQSVYRDLAPDDHALLGEAAQRALKSGPPLAASLIQRAIERSVSIGLAMESLFAQADIIITPTLPVLPPKVGQKRVEIDGVSLPSLSALIADTCLANLCGCPALAVPIPRWAKSAIPPSVMVMAKPGSDHAVLAFVQTLMRMIEPEERI